MGLSESPTNSEPPNAAALLHSLCMETAARTRNHRPAATVCPMTTDKSNPAAPRSSWKGWLLAALLMAILSTVTLAGSAGWFDAVVGSIHLLTALVLGGRAWYGYRIAALES